MAVVDRLEFRVSSTGNASAKSLNRVSQSMHRLGKEAEKSKKSTGKLVAALGRVAFYRAVRSAIKAVTDAFKEGLQNAYQFSQTINSSLSQTMDALKSLGLQATNQLGSAFGELLTTVRPVLESIYNLVIKVADALTQFFAILGGRSVYHKATASTEKWAKATAGGAAAAKEWKNQLMGFDEINRLEEPSDGGGGGGSSADGVGNWELAETNFKWVEELRRVTLDWLSTINFEPLINAWHRLQEAVGHFVEIVDGALYWAYTEVLLPLAGWTIEEGAPALLNALAAAFEWLNAVLEKLKPLWDELWNETIKPFFEWIGDGAIYWLEKLTTCFENLTSKLENSDSFEEYWRKLSNGEQVLLAIAGAIALVMFVLSPTKLIMLGVIAVGVLLYKNWDKICEWANKLKDKLDELKGKWQGFLDFIRPVTDGIANAFQTVIDKVTQAINTIKAFFGINVAQGSTTTISGSGATHGGSGGGFAAGGYPQEGEYFLARESGPELVGTIGGRTAVANNDQIVAAVSQGVFQAVSSAMSGSGGNTPVNIYLDGKQIASSTTRYQKQFAQMAHA